ncbi:MAG TPA: phosphoribosyltransferase family protein [Candidatus Saccharimonadales bacterium]|nr:phosphoribosyltransferase family protein [Candidatus Saccharimonadales bacterium]
MQCAAGQALYSVRARTVYDGTAKALVAKLKFERARAAARDIAYALPEPPAYEGHELLIVHVPTATSRIRERGYDQAQLIARRYAKIHAMAYMPALARMGQQRQLGGSGVQRRHQLESAFRVVRPAAIAGKHIILVDDVVTTGATLAAAAAALKAAGARRVEAVTFARA